MFSNDHHHDGHVALLLPAQGEERGLILAYRLIMVRDRLREPVGSTQDQAVCTNL